MTLPEASFPEDPTLRADLVRGESGEYTTTLTLPGGQRQTFASDELDEARSRVIATVRAYLAEEVGHPARLRVEDPDGSWLLGIPHDNSALVPLPGPPGEQPRPRSDSTPRPRLTAATPVLPSRPAPPRQRRRRRWRPAGAPRDPNGRRVGAFAAFALAFAAAAGAVVAIHGPGSHSRPAVNRHAPVTRHASATRHASVTPITTKATQPTTKAPTTATRPSTSSRPATKGHRAHHPSSRRHARASHEGSKHHGVIASRTHEPATTIDAPATTTPSAASTYSAPASTATPPATSTPPARHHAPPARYTHPASTLTQSKTSPKRAGGITTESTSPPSAPAKRPRPSQSRSPRSPVRGNGPPPL